MNEKKEQSAQGKSKTRILIVDDHAVVREGLTSLINQETDLVVSAGVDSAEKALDALNKQQFDLAIVDISLNGMDGIQLTEKIKSQHPSLPVLILTMHDEESCVKGALQAGAKGYLTKREAASTIIDAIRSIISGKDNVGERLCKNF